MTRDVRVYLDDVLDSVEKIESFISTRTEDEFLQDWSFQDVIMHRLEIIGEAVKKIPFDIKEQHPDIPWKKISGMRDVLAHEYYRIDLRRVWKVVQRDLPRLKAEVRAILGDME